MFVLIEAVAQEEAAVVDEGRLVGKELDFEYYILACDDVSDRVDDNK